MITALGVDVTYLGPGPSLENMKPVESREKRNTTPTGLDLKATSRSGNKLEVRNITVNVGALTTLGSWEVTHDVVKGKEAVRETGHLATAKVVSGGGGKGTCAVENEVGPDTVPCIV